MAASNNNTTIVYSVDASGTEAGVNKLKASLGQANASMDAAAKKAALVDAAMKEAASNGLTLTERQANKTANAYLRLAETAGKTKLEIMNSRAAAMGAGTAFAGISKEIEEASEKTHEFGFATAASKRELLVLAHELSQGNYKRFGGSLMVLGEQTGAAGLLFSAAGIAALAMGAAIAGAAVEVYKGYAAFEDLSKAAAMTNGYLGLTSSQFLDLSRSSADAGVSIIQAQTAMTALVSSGKISADQLGLATKATVAFANETGVSVDKAAEAMIAFAENPQKALEKLQGQYHTFSAAQVDVIQNYIDTGNKAAAAAAGMQDVLDASDRFKTAGAADVGYVAATWEVLRKIVVSVGNAISQVGVSSSHQDDLNAALQRQAQLRSAINANASSGHADIYGYKSRMADADAAVAAAKKVVDADQSVADAQKKRAAGGDAEVRGDAYLRDTRYATPKERQGLDLKAENQNFAEATKGLDTASSLYEQDLARHLSNIQQINEQYAKRTKVHTNDGAKNAMLAQLTSANALIEAEEKRSATVLKGLHEDGTVDTESYLTQLHAIQVKAIDAEMVNAAQRVEIAKGKKEQTAAIEAQRVYDKLAEQRKQSDADLTTGLGAYQNKRAADIAKYQSDANSRVAYQANAYDTADVTSTMTAAQADEYRQRQALYEEFLRGNQALKDRYDSKQIDPTKFAAELAVDQTAYAQQDQQLTDHLAKQQAARESFSTQFTKANASLIGNGITPAETLANGYVTAFDDASSALDKFVTTGQFSLRSFTAGILSDFSSLALKFAENQAVSSLFGTGLSSMIGSISGGLSTAAAAPVANTIGGSDVLGSFIGLTGNAYATGGHVSGPGSSTSDSIPAMLSNGEYVINARATSQHRGLLEAINSGTAARFATGGAVGSVQPASSSGTSGGTSSNDVSVTVNNNSGGSMDATDAADLHATVQAFVDKRMAQKMRGQGGYAYQIKHNQI